MLFVGVTQSVTVGKRNGKFFFWLLLDAYGVGGWSGKKRPIEADTDTEHSLFCPSYIPKHIGRVWTWWIGKRDHIACSTSSWRKTRFFLPA